MEQGYGHVGGATRQRIPPGAETTDSELITVDGRGAKHCGPSSIFRIERENVGQEGDNEGVAGIEG